MGRFLHISLAFAMAFTVSAVTTVSEDAKIVHALDRLTFGARPGDLEQVRAMGLKKWIELQLNPKKIPENPVLLEKLRPLDTLNMNARDLVKNYPTPQMIAKLAAGNGTYPTEAAKRRLVEVQVDQYRRERSKDAPERQIATFLTSEQRQTLQSGKREEKVEVLNSLSGVELDEALLFMPRRGREQLYPIVAPELRRRIQKSLGAFRIIDQDLVNGKLYRAVYSNQQLAEVLADFWFNHFNVYQLKGDDRFMVPAYEREVIRPRVLGKFKDLLLATAESPAMLIYLDNYQSVAEGTAKGRKNKQRNNEGEKRGLNENYGRELMELHTMGVNGGYTQKMSPKSRAVSPGGPSRIPLRAGVLNSTAPPTTTKRKWSSMFAFQKAVACRMVSKCWISWSIIPPPRTSSPGSWRSALCPTVHRNPWWIAWR